MKKKFKPHHIAATSADLEGNNGIGRYIFLPGSDARAQKIAKYFTNVKIRSHERGHHFYFGTIDADGTKIDVATVATGMGCPSMEIILHELFHLGGKRFLRVGTAGTLQNYVHVGDLVNAQASVRDEDTTSHYMPDMIPALASLEFLSAILLAAEKLQFSEKLHTGIVHCKSSLYACEYGIGPERADNQYFQKLLENCGVLASEMETAALFVQSQFYNYELMKKGNKPQHRVLSGAVLAVVATAGNDFDTTIKAENAEKNAIELALETVKIVALQENLE